MELTILGTEHDYGFTKFCYVSFDQVNFKICFEKIEDTSNNYWEKAELESLDASCEHTQEVILSDIPAILTSMSIEESAAESILKNIVRFADIRKSADPLTSKLVYERFFSEWSLARENSEIIFACIPS